jgi:hypothetical protein
MIAASTAPGLVPTGCPLQAVTLLEISMPDELLQGEDISVTFVLLPDDGDMATDTSEPADTVTGDESGDCESGNLPGTGTGATLAGMATTILALLLTTSLALATVAFGPRRADL